MSDRCLEEELESAVEQYKDGLLPSAIPGPIEVLDREYKRVEGFTQENLGLALDSCSQLLRTYQRLSRLARYVWIVARRVRLGRLRGSCFLEPAQEAPVVKDTVLHSAPCARAARRPGP